MNKTKRKNKGITLIALVITIIVLLILAGVTIASLSGDNGILTRAAQAKKQNEKGEAEDTIKLLLSEIILEKNVGTKNLETLLGEKFDTVTPEGENFIITKDGYEATVDKNGTLIGDIQKAGPRPVVDEQSIKITTDGNTVPEDDTVAPGTPLQITFTATIEGGEITKIEPPVPYTTNGTEKSKEFIITGTTADGTYKTKKTINVANKYKIDHQEIIINKIQDINNGIIKEVREGNIPIPDGYTYVKGDKKGGAVIREDTTLNGPSREANPIEFVWVPVDNLSEMYGTEGQEKYGILYNFPSPYESKKKYEGKAQGTTYREPDVVSDYDTGKLEKTNLQTEFNKMTTSVGKYKGFYIGRYESSIIGNGENSYLAPKYGVNSATAADSATNQWYGLYNKQKAYKNQKNENIKATMIWGCQYDAMLRWLQQSGINVTSNIGENRNQGNKTGTVETDKLNNIYDLYGNRFEWTLEADRTSYRVCRGGCYYGSYSPSNRYFSSSPTDTSSFSSTRATLYIP